MVLATRFLITNQHILNHMAWWLCGVLVLIGLVLFKRFVLKRGEP